MPKTAITILAFISNPTTKNEDVDALCEQIHVVYDGNRKVSTLVTDAVRAVYDACAKEEIAREVYTTIEAIASINKLALDEPLFLDMAVCKDNPPHSQQKRDNYRNPVEEPTV